MFLTCLNSTQGWEQCWIQAWWHMPVVSALGMLRNEDHKFEKSELVSVSRNWNNPKLHGGIILKEFDMSHKNIIKYFIRRFWNKTEVKQEIWERGKERCKEVIKVNNWIKEISKWKRVEMKDLLFVDWRAQE